MAAREITRKLHIYHTLYRLNLSFTNIVAHCNTLQEAGVFRAKYANIFRGYTLELQAEMNEEVLEIMHSTELDDWGRFGKIRQARDKELADPDDVFIFAEERRKELAKERKKKKESKSEAKSTR
jgi:hypothetical protein